MNLDQNTNQQKISKSTPLSEIMKLGSECLRKNNCCKHGAGFLVTGDIERISKFLRINEKEIKEKYLVEKEMFNKKMLRPKVLSKKISGKNMPFGVCVFFDQKINGCKIHSVKPLQCRTGTCSAYGEEISAWFLLNYIIDANDAECVRQYVAYIKSGGKIIPGGKLEDIVPDCKKLAKIMSYEILK